MQPPTLNSDRSMSDTLYVRGISRRTTDEELLSRILDVMEAPVETDLHSKRKAGVIWARYSSWRVAQQTIIRIHQTIWYSLY